MSTIKNPEHEAQDPAPMPHSQQGQGGHKADHDGEGQQGGTHHKARMAPQPDAAPGLEQDEHGDVIPLAQRTRDDQEKAAKS